MREQGSETLLPCYKLPQRYRTLAISARLAGQGQIVVAAAAAPPNATHTASANRTSPTITALSTATQPDQSL